MSVFGLVILGWWTGVIDQPIVLLVAFVISEAISFVLLFGKKVWERIEPDLINIIASGIKGWIAGEVVALFYRFKRRYLQQIIYMNRVFNVRGLRTRGAYALEVERVFVDLQIAPSHMQSTDTNLLSQRRLSGSKDVWSFLQQVVNQKATGLVIIGPPGSGKTTLLQHVALAFAQKQRRLRLLRRRHIPITLFLREHADTIIAAMPPLSELVQQFFSNGKRYPNLNPPYEWFKRKLSSGRCIVLLDGLDEIPQVKDRRLISKWVDEQILSYPRSLFVVTARTQGYISNPLSNAHVLEVLPFSPGQSAKFIRNWYLANKMIMYGKDDEGVRQDADTEANDLMRRIRQQPAIGTMTVNPLLLTMICTVHNHRGSLPGRRIELYSEIVDVLLGHWQLAKEIPDFMTPGQKRAILQPLAAHMMSRKDGYDRRTISVQEALAVISPCLQQINLSSDRIDDFLDRVSNSGLIVEKEPGFWSFAHLTFQEYLCAAHWHDTGEPARWDEQIWKSLVSDSWWHETLRLFSAQGDGTAVAKACLKISDVSALTLVADIVDEALKMDSEIRNLVIELLYRNLEHVDEALRNQAARVYLNHRLRSAFIRIDEEREIDTTCVTNAEYQLFINREFEDMRYLQPPHWEDMKFTAESAQDAVTGTRAGHALAFCKWLTAEFGQHYRLPTLHEIDDFNILEGGGVGVWLDDRNIGGLSADRSESLSQFLKSSSSLPMPESVLSILNEDINRTLYNSNSISFILEMIVQRTFDAPGFSYFRLLSKVSNTRSGISSRVRFAFILTGYFIIFLFGAGVLFDLYLSNTRTGAIVFFSVAFVCLISLVVYIANAFGFVFTVIRYFTARIKLRRVIRKRAKPNLVGSEPDFTMIDYFDPSLERNLGFDFKKQSIAFVSHLLDLLKVPEADISKLVHSYMYGDTRALEVSFDRQIAPDMSFLMQIQKVILSSAVEVAKAKSRKQWQHAYYGLIAQIAEYGYLHDRYFSEAIMKHKVFKQANLRIYWLYHVLQLRCDQRLPSWEGIRLVRGSQGQP